MPIKTGPNYTGVLKEPIRPPKNDEELTPEELATDFERQYMARVAALFDHYGLKFGQPGAHAILALNLAADHIDGFTVVLRRPGRAKKRKGDLGIKLFTEVQA